MMANARPVFSKEVTDNIKSIVDEIGDISPRFYLGKSVLASEHILDRKRRSWEQSANIKKIQLEYKLNKIDKNEAKKLLAEEFLNSRIKIYVRRSKKLEDNQSLVFFFGNKIEIIYPKQQKEENDSALFTRLLIAHELGHVFLHPEENDPHQIEDDKKRLQLEAEANEFAIQLIQKKSFYYNEFCKENYEHAFFYDNDKISACADRIWEKIVKFNSPT